MRYFAMIDGERRGPFELDRLAEAGVGPDTYVWCKGMADWQKAEDVADICRYFRQHLSDIMHPPAPAPVAELAPEEPAYGAFAPDTSSPPAPTLFISIFMTLFCFPVTGLVAIYYSYKARVAWQESQRSETQNNRGLYSEAERENLRRLAHDYDRSARMWIGITFFLSLIFYAFVTHKFL